jgi:hypothetical protein
MLRTRNGSLWCCGQGTTAGEIAPMVKRLSCLPSKQASGTGSTPSVCSVRSSSLASQSLRPCLMSVWCSPHSHTHGTVSLHPLQTYGHAERSVKDVFSFMQWSFVETVLSL